MPPKEKKWPQGSSSSTGEADEILERLLSIQNRIENGFTKIYDEIETLKTELNDNIKSVKEELGETTKSLNAVWEEVQLLKEENKELKKQLDSTTKKNDTLEKKVETLRSRLVKQEDYSRRENLCFYDIPEEPNETNKECFQKLRQVLTELGAPSDVKFHAVHRTGKPNVGTRTPSTSNEEEMQGPPRPRPILARFLSRMDCDLVWFKRKELLKSACFPTVFIDKDLSPESAKDRAKLRAAFRKAKQLNIAKVLLRGKSLIINSSKYSVDTLPEYLLPSEQSTTPE